MPSFPTTWSSNCLHRRSEPDRSATNRSAKRKLAKKPVICFDELVQKPPQANLDGSIRHSGPASIETWDSDVDIIGQIYEAVDNEACLAELPSAIAREIGSRSCTLQIFSPRFELEGFWYNHFSADMLEFYVENDLHREDAWTSTNLNVFGLDTTERHTDFLPVESFKNTLFYNDFIRHFGDDSAYCLGFISSQPSGGHLVAGLQKALDDDDFTDAQIAAYEVLRPHLVRMVELRRKLERIAKEASRAKSAVNYMSDGYVLVRPDRRVLFANRAAEQMLKDTGPIRVRNGKLYCVDYLSDRKLSRAVAAALRFDEEAPPAFLCHDNVGYTWRVLLSPRFIEGETLLMICFNREALPAASSKATQHLYGLTDPEMRVLLATSNGQSAAQIAEDLSVSLATVRTHQQHVYRKTGVHKASQLAHLVATLPRLESEDR